MKIKIGVVCSFTMQEEMVKEIGQEFSDTIEILTVVGVFESAISPGKLLHQKGVEVIVAWGVTASVLEENLSIPVVEVRVPEMDILQAVKQAHKISNQIGLVTPRPVNKLPLMEELYGVKIKQILFKNKNDVLRGIAEAVTAGCEVIVGRSHITLDTTNQFDTKSLLIGFNPMAMREAFQEAIRLARLRQRERQEYKRLETIFNSMTEGFAVIDNQAKIIQCNHSMKKLLGFEVKKKEGQHIDHILPSNRTAEILNSGVRVDNDFITIGNITFIISYIPVLLSEEIIGVVLILRKTSEIQKIDSKIRRRMLTNEFIAKYTIDNIVGSSPKINSIKEQIKRFAITDSTILISGETGTGKELVAQSIHNLSPRKKNPFVAVNCSALTENLLESQLFGYEEGAFTGAKRGGRTGLFELSHTGTIFLDEVGSMSIGLQAKLLRVLEERQVMRLGGEQLIPIDVRIIAATNKNLASEVKKGKFRDDLFYRLDILPLRTIPLRDMKNDIPTLIKSFTALYSKKHSKSFTEIPKKYYKILIHHTWPGNVRQLRHTIERFILLFDMPGCDDSLFFDFLNDKFDVLDSSNPAEIDMPESILNHDKTSSIHWTIKEREYEHIVKMLEKTSFNISQAALLLKISRSTLYRKLKNFNLA